MSALLTLIYREYCRARLAEMQSTGPESIFPELPEDAGK
jgi:hypothetical protein